MDLTQLDYTLRSDMEFLVEAESIQIDKLSDSLGISKSGIYQNRASRGALERFYAYAYRRGFRLNSVKEDLLKESSGEKILFHGSKAGLKVVSCEGSRSNRDFGRGFYLSEAYDNALAFVCDSGDSCVYSFSCDLGGLRIQRFGTSLDWMLAICHHRGMLPESGSPVVREILERIGNADVIAAPIADNRMFYVMSLFAEGDITADAAIHSLSASKLGLQYVFKTDRSIRALRPIERYYICDQEKSDCRSRLAGRAAEIDTKLKLAKREFRNGPYIEEILK